MIRLYGDWRSLAAYRVRVALNLKGLAFEEQMIDLNAGAQLAAGFRAINPQGAVPVLVAGDGAVLTQSLAIIEYLDEVYPEPALLAADPAGRARVRALALLFAADSHPLITPRVTRYLGESLGVDEAARRAWSRHWLRRSLEQAEALLAGDPFPGQGATGRFCHGDAPGLADICLASQWVGARALSVETGDVPTVGRIGEACLALDPFARAHPLRQPGAPAP